MLFPEKWHPFWNPQPSLEWFFGCFVSSILADVVIQGHLVLLCTPHSYVAHHNRHETRQIGKKLCSLTRKCRVCWCMFKVILILDHWLFTGVFSWDKVWASVVTLVEEIRIRPQYLVSLDDFVAPTSTASWNVKSELGRRIFDRHVINSHVRTPQNTKRRLDFFGFRLAQGF